MYAIVDIAGQQFKVEKNQTIYVNRLTADEGSKVSFDRVLLVEDGGKVQVGTPLVKNMVVTASIVSHLKADKVKVFKKKRRKGYQVLNGHRQALTELLVEAIGEGKVKAAPTAKAEAPKKTAAAEKKAPAASKAKPAAKKKEAPKAESKKPAADKKTTAAKAETKKSAAAKKPASAKDDSKKPAAKKSATTAKKPAAKKAPATKKPAAKAAPKAKKADGDKSDK